MREKKYDQKDVEKLVADYIFGKMGKPKDLRHFRCINLWGCYYRVNVYCLEQADILVKSNEITDSFFVKFSEGEVKSCSPPILEMKYK